MIGESLAWMHYWARSFGIAYAEYHLMTTGEIEDLMLCNAILNGSMEETEDSDTIPDLR